VKTVSVPDGADLDAYISQLKSGDTLSLATNGNYTIGAGTNGFVNVPNGYPDYPTIILGNGATITGGFDGLNWTAKWYINVYDLNWRNQTHYLMTIDDGHYLNFTNCTYASHINAGVLDVLKIFRSHYCTWTDCDVLHTDSTMTTTDGFEFWGPCTVIRCINCTVTDLAEGDSHGFEVYGSTAGEECNDVRFIGCNAHGCDVGFSVEGGAGGIVHVECVADACTYSDNVDADVQGIQGSTIYIENHTTDPVEAGTVVIRS
jgi:hypothetical protein